MREKNRSSAPVLLLALLLCTTLPACPKREVQQAGQVQEVRPLCETPGTYLVYTVNDPRSGLAAARRANVLIATPDGKRREILFDYPGFIFHLVPSPDGRHVAFVGSLRGADGQELRDLFLFDTRTHNYVDISSAGHFSRAVKGAPLFTPDGRSVLFISQWAVNSGEFNVFKADVESGRLGGLYTEPVEDVPLTMMPDGRRCVAVRRVPNTGSSFEYIAIDVESGAAETLCRFDNITKLGPAFFDPEGKTLFYDMKPIDPGSIMASGIRSRELWSINLETLERRILLDPATVSYVYQVFRDKNGELRLLLRRQEAMEEEDTPMSRLATCKADGSDFVYLTGTDARSYLLPPPSNIPPISPDYSLLFFYRQDPVFNNEDIWVMKPDGSDPVNISNTAGYPEGSAGWMVIPES